MNLSRYGFAVLYCLLLPVGCGPQTQVPHSSLHEAPDARNDPARLGIQSRSIDHILLQASLDSRMTWSGSYWPSYRLGIAGRWQDEWLPLNPYQVAPVTLQEVMSMSIEQLNRLSPAEKYDLITGRSDFPVTTYELAQSRRHWSQSGGQIPAWFGICDGWAIASVLLPEPRQTIRVQSPFGFEIDIYPSDLKAMLSFFFARTTIYARVVGGRCNQQVVDTDTTGRPLRSECRDLNAATMHLALEEFIGRRGEPIIVDIQPGHEVWNVPVTAYQYTYSNLRELRREPNYPHAATGTVYLIDVNARLDYTALSQPQYEAVGARSTQVSIRYTLELDANHYIIGGEWITRNHPDFLWELMTFESVSRRVPSMTYETLFYLLRYAH